MKQKLLSKINNEGVVNTQVESDFLNYTSIYEVITERQSQPIIDARITKANEEDCVNNQYLIPGSSNNGEFAIDFNGVPTYIRSSAIKSLCDRAKISGGALGKLSSDDFIHIVNKCMEVADKNEEMLIVKIGDKLSAFLSDGYQVIRVDKIYDLVTNKMKEYSSQFCEGCLSNDLILATWVLKDNRIVKLYDEVFEGIQFKGALPLLTVETSNTGFSAVNIIPKIRTNHTDFIIGKQIHIEHKGNSKINTVETQLDSIYALFKKSLTDIQKLKQIKVYHPKEAFLNTAKTIGVSKKYASIVLDDFLANINYGNVCSAYDIYLGLTEILIFLQDKNTDAVTIANMQETIARALFINYSNVDVSTVSWKIN